MVLASPHFYGVHACCLPPPPTRVPSLTYCAPGVGDYVLPDVIDRTHKAVFGSSAGGSMVEMAQKHGAAIPVCARPWALCMLEMQNAVAVECGMWVVVA